MAEGDLTGRLDYLHEVMTDEDRASFGLEAQGLCNDCRCYGRGVRDGRLAAARDLRATGIPDDQLPVHQGILFQREHAARIAEGQTDED